MQAHSTCIPFHCHNFFLGVSKLFPIIKRSLMSLFIIQIFTQRIFFLLCDNTKDNLIGKDLLHQTVLFQWDAEEPS